MSSGTSLVEQLGRDHELRGAQLGGSARRLRPRSQVRRSLKEDEAGADREKNIPEGGRG